MEARTRTIAWALPITLAGILMAAQTFGAEWVDPLRPAPETPPITVPLRPPDQPAQQPKRAPVVLQPAFGWRAGDRVVVLGDSVMAREAQLGFFECRLMAQQPDREYQIRNLHWLTNHPLAQADATGDMDWLGEIRAELAPLQPTVIALAFGNDIVLGDPGEVEAFRDNLERLINALAGDADGVHPRFLLFSPVGWIESAEASAETRRALDLRRPLAESILAVATERNAEFVDLISWVEPTARFLEVKGESNEEPFPPMFDDFQRLTAYGYWRAVLALEASLRWSPPNWRFGLGLDGSLRDGGFGAVLMEHNRNRTSMRVRKVERVLPLPHPEGFVDRHSDTRPQRYIQLSSLNPGTYALQVDGVEIQRASEAEWARYQIVTDGPSWGQAEELRRLIIEKNDLVAQRWGPDGKARLALEQQPDMTMFNDPAIAGMERKIFEIRKPVPRVYEVVRVSDTPNQP